jgi:parallel beta-helix repeat protein
MSARYHTHVGGVRRAPLWWVIFLLLATLPVIPIRAAADLRGARVVTASPENTVVVTTTSDHLDADADTSSFATLNSQPGADGAISLREALLAANTTPTTTLELTINFSIPISDTGYSYDSASGRQIWTILVAYDDFVGLPPLARGHVRIDGTTQSATGDAPHIILEGSNNFDDPANGLTITSANNEVRGLAILNFWNNGIAISGSAAAYNQIAGCYIGTDALGRSGDQTGNGVSLSDGAHHNMIGGIVEADRNLISGNKYSDGVGNNYSDGVLIADVATAYNTVAGNWIGLDATGLGALPNGQAGIRISGGAHDNMIGGITSVMRNVISSNEAGGVVIEGAATTRNTVANNRIGVDTTGQAVLTGARAGVVIGDAHHNLIGGAGQGNLIAGNDSGIDINGGVANTVSGNTLGLAFDGTTRLGNRDVGIYIRGSARDNIIGGTTDGTRNVIAGSATWFTEHGGRGIYIYGPNTTNNTVQGNYIGVDVSGNRPAGHRREGILITGNANGNTIGGVAEAARNVIADNGFSGIALVDTSSNLVAGNLIGLGANEITQLDNQANGIRVWNAYNVIGPYNYISNSRLSGIRFSGSNTTIISNTIKGNTRSGICGWNSGTTIQDSTIQGNEITENGGASGTDLECPIQGGVIISNTIDTLVSGNEILDNIGAGITVRAGAENQILSNSISGNSGGGIVLLEGANGNISAPRISQASSTNVSGTSCPLCHVQIFTDDGDQGQSFVKATTALVDGSFSVTIAPGALVHPHVTATNTDPSGNTSPFAEPKPLSDQPQPIEYKVNLPLVRLR